MCDIFIEKYLNEVNFRFLFRMFLLFFLFVFIFNSSALGDSLPQSVVPLGFGVATHFRNSPGLSEIKLMKGAGISIARTCLEWSNVEKEKGVFDFDPYLSLVDQLNAAGIQPLIILAYGNRLYDQSLPPFHDGINTESSRMAFARYAAAAAMAFRDKNVLWEIWNEPNLKNYWRPEPSPSEYVDMTILAANAIKSVDKNASVFAISLSGFTKKAFSYLEGCLKLNILDFVDGISIHPYRRKNPETVLTDYDKLNSLLVKYNQSKKDIKVICSEWGYSSNVEVDIQSQGDYAVRMYLLNLSSGIPVTIWYDWRDDGYNLNNRQDNFGLFTKQDGPKPSYFTLKKMNSELNGFRLVRRQQSTNSDDWVLLFENETQKKLVFWTTGAPHQIKVSLTPNGPVFQLKLSSSPQYQAFP